MSTLTVRRVFALSGLALLFTFACSGSSSPPIVTALPPDPVDTTAVEPAEPTGETIDRGTFTLAVKDEQVGSETFEVVRLDSTPGYLIRSETRLSAGGVTLEAAGTLTTGADWRPVGAEFQSTVGGAPQRATLTASPDDGALTLATATGEQPPVEVRQSRPVDLFLANNVFAHMAPVCHLDLSEARTVHAFPGMPLKLGARTTRQIRTTTVATDLGVALDVILADVGAAARVEIYCDADRLVLVHVPMQSFVAVRDGYEAAATSVAGAIRQKPPTPDDLRDLDRSVEVAAAEGIEPATLACSLMLPASHEAVERRVRRGPTRALPAVVFITGSGPQDRDEDTVGPGGLKMSIFKVMAIELARAGVASLRCDDRGVGASTGTFAGSTLDTFAADVAAMVAALRAEPAIDPARVGLVGHSEGGIIGPLVASRDKRVKALVLMAGTGRPLDAIILEQVERGLARGGMRPEEAARELERMRTAFAAIRDEQPLPDDMRPDERAQWETQAAWLRSHFRHDPVTIARTLRGVPVFIAQGEMDVQVTVEDAELLREAFTKAGNKRVRYQVYPGLNHLFARTETGSMAEYSDPEAEVDEGFLGDVVAFLRKHL